MVCVCMLACTYHGCSDPCSVVPSILCVCLGLTLCSFNGHIYAKQLWTLHCILKQCHLFGHITVACGPKGTFKTLFSHLQYSPSSSWRGWTSNILWTRSLQGCPPCKEGTLPQSGVRLWWNRCSLLKSSTTLHHSWSLLPFCKVLTRLSRPFCGRPVRKHWCEVQSWLGDCMPPY